MGNPKFDRTSQMFFRMTRVAGTLAVQRAETQLAELVGIFKRDKTNLKTLVMTNSDRESTDPRDQIYALLGLASCPESMTVDYSKSRSVRDVYTEATKVMISDVTNNWREPPKPSLNIICSAYRAYGRSKHDLPSWVPDFSVKQELVASFVFDVIEPDNDKASFGYNAMGDNGITTQFSFDIDDVLIVSGVFIGHITKINPPLEKPRNRHWDFKLWEPDNLDSSTYRHTGETAIDAFWQTLLFSELPRFQAPNMDKYRDEFLIWSGRKRRRNWVDLEGTHESYSREFDSRQCDVRGFTFGSCNSGYWGMIPGVSKVGDVVCVARGLSVPVVLRLAKCEPAPAGGPSTFTFTFNLVGPCYIHGAMDGEVAVETKAGKRIERQIRIG
ncbi:hypothetical protein N431DRAFT_465213 [Stipitochalara longipes BDJ]|nr:hypothetical protein N431DRAFT_465213 [Stipitochalara longipes BDJ]